MCSSIKTMYGSTSTESLWATNCSLILIFSRFIPQWLISVSKHEEMVRRKEIRIISKISAYFEDKMLEKCFTKCMELLGVYFSRNLYFHQKVIVPSSYSVSPYPLTFYRVTTSPTPSLRYGYLFGVPLLSPHHLIEILFRFSSTITL